MTDRTESVKTERRRELAKHLGHLDALRGIAVLGVILIHIGQAFPNKLYEYVNNPGMRGVQLFFVVSAFTLLLSSQQRKTEAMPTVAFFLRRFFRLAPLYYVFVLLAFYTVPDLRSIGWLHTLPALFFLHNFFPRYVDAGTYGGWSLGVEATFYLCFPLLLRYITSLQRAVLWLLCVGTLSTAVWVIAATLHPDLFVYWSYSSFTVEAPVFLFGFVCFYVWRDYCQPLCGTERGKWASAALLLLTLLMLVNVVPVNGWKTMFASTMCATLLLAVLLYQWAFLVNRVTIFFGKVSYSMYLIHGALIWTVIPHLKKLFPVLAHHSNNFLWCMGAYVVIVILSASLGALTWTYIE